MKRIIRRMGRLSILALIAGSAGGASAQTMGSTVQSFNILGKTAITLTGFATQPLYVPVVGTSPGNSLTLTRASVGVYHGADTTATTGQTEATTLNTSITAPGGATIIALGAATLPTALNVGPGITIYTAAANVTNTNTTLTITGSATSVVIFQVTTALSLTDADVILAGGILPSNVYWQVGTAVNVTNDDAASRTFPGTVINNTAATDITVVCSGAGSLAVGRLISRGGSISLTQSGAGTLTIAYPGGLGAIADATCKGTDLIFPSPATGPTAQFSYCMGQLGTVKIRVYNAIGDIVAKIEDTKAAGPQLSTLNTGRLAPGVYFYFLEKHYGGGDTFKGGVKKFVVVH